METEFRHFIVPNDHIVYSIDKEYKKIILEVISFFYLKIINIIKKKNLLKNINNYTRMN